MVDGELAGREQDRPAHGCAVVPSERFEQTGRRFVLRCHGCFEEAAPDLGRTAPNLVEHDAPSPSTTVMRRDGNLPDE
nr:hypothetical protein [Micromonospora sp. DSM 115978]